MVDSPLELVKLRAQVNYKGNLKYRTEIKSIIATEGYPGLYRGLLPTILRDSVGCSIYFAFFEYLKLKVLKEDDETH